MSFLIKYNFDYADEFNVEGFRILENKAEMEDLFVALKARLAYNSEIYFGSNESIDFDCWGTFYRGLVITEISDIEAKCIKDTLGAVWGLGNFLEL